MVEVLLKAGCDLKITDRVEYLPHACMGYVAFPETQEAHVSSHPSWNESSHVFILTQEAHFLYCFTCNLQWCGIALAKKLLLSSDMIKVQHGQNLGFQPFEEEVSMHKTVLEQSFMKLMLLFFFLVAWGCADGTCTSTKDQGHPILFTHPRECSPKELLLPLVSSCILGIL